MLHSAVGFRGSMRNKTSASRDNNLMAATYHHYHDHNPVAATYAYGSEIPHSRNNNPMVVRYRISMIITLWQRDTPMAGTYPIRDMITL